MGEQATRCLQNLEAVCQAGGTTLANAVRVGVFLTDLGGDWADVNAAYEQFFDAEPPCAGGRGRRRAAEERARGDRSSGRAAVVDHTHGRATGSSRTSGRPSAGSGSSCARPRCSSGELSRRVGARVLLKAENLQLTGSFKARGATNTIAGLSRRALRAGVVAASAGNHAQAVAFAARDGGRARRARDAGGGAAGQGGGGAPVRRRGAPGGRHLRRRPARRRELAAQRGADRRPRLRRRPTWWPGRAPWASSSPGRRPTSGWWWCRSAAAAWPRARRWRVNVAPARRAGGRRAGRGVRALSRTRWPPTGRSARARPTRSATGSP